MMDIIPKFVDEALSPIAKSAGNTIAGCWNLVFGNQVNLWLRKQEVRHQNNYEDFVERTQAKINEIPQENIKEPEMHIIGPAIDASKFYINSEELRELFANLISASVDNTKSIILHPAFVEIIKQLSPIDAKILQHFNPPTSIAIVKLKNSSADDYYLETFKHIVNFEETSNHRIHSTSLSNLERLGLISISYNDSLSNMSKYDYVENHPAFQETKEQLKLLQKESSDFVKSTFQPGVTQLTPLGKDFIAVCL